MISDALINAELDELRDFLEHMDLDEENLIPLMKDALRDWTPDDLKDETGTVLTVGDGIATVSGLKSAMYSEILIFAGGVRGMILDLKGDTVGCILFGDDRTVTEGSIVRRTGRTAAMGVGEGYIGRVIDPIGNPIDGNGRILNDGYRKVDAPAPGIIERQPVNTPLETGILAIDSMFPIGRGQRELIIGDRQTGKTAIATDTILNQKGKGVICIYVAIGQKASSVARLYEELKKRGAMEYTTIIAATASDSAPLQYIVPYAGTALGEYFMHKGRDVLIVYDDLSKHAIAYRTISLLLERSPGREAYPGDVFYLHSRLLERSAHLSDELGGGSLTALPIIETQAGDVSAYIPTNVISITDGQIFLESGLFFSGQRPAVNVGISVSRVGGDAQTKAMKKAAAGMKLTLAVYREMEVFTQFSSDLDETTKKQLQFGQGVMRILRQKQYHPYSQAEQVFILTAALRRVLVGIPIDSIGEFIEGFLKYSRYNLDSLMRSIEDTGKMSDEEADQIEKAAIEYRDEYFLKGLGR